MLKIFNLKILFIFVLTTLINENVYSNWVKIVEVTGSSCILTFEDIILVGTDNGIYHSMDNGISWSHYTVDISYSVITDLTKNDDYIFAGTFNGVYSSADTGEIWSCLGPSYSILSVYAKDFTIFACIHGGGLFRSENNGHSWTPIGGNHFYSYLVYNDKIFTGTFTGIYVSIDNGLNWNLAGLSNKIITSLSKNDKYFFAANYTHGIYRSDDYGILWSESNQGLPFDHFHPYSVFAKDSMIFAGLTSNKIYLSTDNGLNWMDFSNGLNISEETYHVKFELSGSKIFVSFLYNSLWYYDLSQMTNVSEIENSMLNRFILQQNYPNPFNQSTMISYSVPRSDRVILKIYDVLGSEIKTVVNEFQKVGTYKVEYKTDGITSGIYFYKLQVGSDFMETKKMMFLR